MKQVNFQFADTSANLASAIEVIEVIWPWIADIGSFADLGGGMGSWSKALELKGISNFNLIDHPLTPVENILIENKSNFTPVDLELDLPVYEHYDLVICTEVFEHFSEKRALELLEWINASTDFILFSAAIPRQGGLGHVNLQRHAYWHEKFSNLGFSFFDGFKPEIISNQGIKYWFRQNLFLYHRGKFTERFQNLSNITNPEFELVHKSILNKPIGRKEWLGLFLTLFFRKKKN